MGKGNFPFKLPLVLDGATGTELIKRGLPAGENVQMWVLDHPEAVQEIQKDYYSAGSDAVYACTFGATPRILEENGVLLSAREVCMLTAKISRESAGERLLGASVAPSGAMFYPMGDDTFDFAVEEYKQAVMGAEHFVDFFTAETYISTLEAKAAVTAVKEVSDKPVFVTLTVDKNGKTLCGDEVLPSLITLAKCGISAFGLNCSFGPDLIIDILKKVSPYAVAMGIELIAKPNAGLPKDDGGFDLTVEEFASFIPEALKNGIGILGGCCGTNKEYIKKIKECTESTPLTYPEALDFDFENTVSNTRKFAVVIENDMPEPICVSDYLYEDVEVQAEKYGYGFVRLEQGECDLLNEQLAYITAPLVLCGDRDECDKFAYSYAGKTLYKEI